MYQLQIFLSAFPEGDVPRYELLVILEERDMDRDGSLGVSDVLDFDRDFPPLPLPRPFPLPPFPLPPSGVWDLEVFPFFPVPFFVVSCSKLHESPLTQLPFSNHWKQSPRRRVPLPELLWAAAASPPLFLLSAVMASS